MKDMTSHDVPSHESSDLFKITKKVYDLSKKPKNARKGLEDFLKKEGEVLKSYFLYLQN